LNTAQTVVVGLGEVGKPILQLISVHQGNVIGIDLEPLPAVKRVGVLHICYPFQIDDFVGVTQRYIEHFEPALTIINSTVAVGTTRAIGQCAGAAVVNSPVRGKHARMLQDLQRYTKFIGAFDIESGAAAARHFESAGLKTKLLASPEATELAKLTETTYFGLMIAWAQELERYCDQSSVSYDEIISFYEEIAFFPEVKYFPGVIGGHCVMPNIELLGRFTESAILRAIENSNRKKIEREQSQKGKRDALASKDLSVAV
jgi:UDP-N-acetyl-D-mannosaminuronate dehydrogenase